MVGRNVITDTMKHLILEGSPPLCPGCGPILTEIPTFKLWLVSTVVSIVLSMGILILSSLADPCVTALGEDLEPAGVLAIIQDIPPHCQPSCRPPQHLAGSNQCPHSCPFGFSVCISSSRSRTPAWIRPPLTSNFLRPAPSTGQSADPGQTSPCPKGRWGTSTEHLIVSAVA